MSAWGDDIITIDTEINVPLSPRQEALRDGIAPPLPNEGAARQRRLDQMRREIVECTDLIADLDRYQEHAKDAPLIGGIVGPMMKAYIKDVKCRAQARSKQLHADIAFLQGLTL